MSAHLSGQTPSSFGDGKLHQNLDPSLDGQESNAISNVENALIKSGVRPEKASSLAQVVMTQVASYHSGPLPTVRDFAGYEQICPGAARDILEMAKTAQANAHALQMAETYGEIWLKTLGVAAGLFVVGAMMYAAIYSALNGHDWVAGTIASGSGLALVAGVFIRISSNTPPKAADQPKQKQKSKRR